MDDGQLSHRTIRTNGISMHVVEQGAGPAVVLCHGFPELWFSWRHQLPALAAAGYRAIAPDQRGYGRTDAPAPVEDYDILHLTDDLVGLLDALELDKAVFVGHDWGALVVWQLALLHPGRVAGVVGMSVPYFPRTPIPPTQLFKQVAGDNFMYILYFQTVGPADAELAADARRSMSRILWSISGDALPGSFRTLRREGTGFLDPMQDPPALPGWLPEADLDYFASEFARTGFTGGLNWYRNFDRNWNLTPQLAAAKVTLPTFFIAGDKDPVIGMTPVESMKPWLPDLRGAVLLPGAGHWTQQERPQEVNTALLDFLSGL